MPTVADYDALIARENALLREQKALDEALAHINAAERGINGGQMLTDAREAFTDYADPLDSVRAQIEVALHVYDVELHRHAKRVMDLEYLAIERADDQRAAARLMALGLEGVGI